MACQCSSRFCPAALAALLAGFLLAAPAPVAAQTDTTLWVSKVGGAGVVTTVPFFYDGCPVELIRCYFVLPAGATVALVAEPVPGVLFRSWGGDADCVDGVVTMSSDRRCLAFFDSGPPTPGGTDFNLDGHSDVLWQHPSGWVTAWLMNRTGLLEAQAIYTGVTDWRPVATGDIDGDGHSDLIWQHRSGMVTAWLLHGTTFVDAVSIYTGDTFWRVGAAEDLNHDGHADIIWWVPGHIGDAGYISCWLTRGGQLQEARALSTMESGASFVGTGDFNGDHQPDLVVQAEDGRVSVIPVWPNLEPDSNPTSLYWGSTDWRVVGLGDYDGDGLSDLVWQHHIGYVTAWLMDGVEFREARSIYTGATTWKAIAR